MDSAWWWLEPWVLLGCCCSRTNPGKVLSAKKGHIDHEKVAKWGLKLTISVKSANCFRKWIQLGDDWSPGCCLAVAVPGPTQARCWAPKKVILTMKKWPNPRILHFIVNLRKFSRKQPQMALNDLKWSQNARILEKNYFSSIFLHNSEKSFFTTFRQILFVSQNRT